MMRLGVIAAVMLCGGAAMADDTAAILIAKDFPACPASVLQAPERKGEPLTCLSNGHLMQMPTDDLSKAAAICHRNYVSAVGDVSGVTLYKYKPPWQEHCEKIDYKKMESERIELERIARETETRDLPLLDFVRGVAERKLP